MFVRRLGFLLLVFSAASPSAVSQTPVGQIVTAIDFVEIDAFGVGEFVDVRAPEYVYAESIIRTDYESWAYLKIDGQDFTVAPNSTTPVASFLTSRRRERGGGFFRRILSELTRSLAPPEKEQIVPGGRASEAANGNGTTWVFEVDPNELYEEALLAIEDGDFEMAVESLKAIEFPSDGDYAVEDYYVNLSYSLMGIGDFHSAMTTAFDYLVLPATPQNARILPVRLKLLGGIAAFYLGDDEVADAALEGYLESIPLEEAAPEAVAARYELLRASGRTRDASRLLSGARSAQPSVDWNTMVQP